MGEVLAGRYELLLPIAAGGMGEVWEVLDLDTGQHLAAKILRQSDAGALLRFMREQSMRINHPHVVTPQSWAGMDDRVMFTMPLVRGGSVADLLAEHGPLPAAYVVHLLDQALQALQGVHASRVVHRDVKPANLLLEPTGDAAPHLRLTDFGIAAPIDQPRMTHASMVVGSPGYLAPEQRHGGDPDYRQDIYSLGVTGIEMLTGTRPLADGGIPPLPDPHPRQLRDLLATATAADPARRYPTADAMRAALDTLGPPRLDGSVQIRDRFASDGPTPSGVGRADRSTALQPGVTSAFSGDTRREPVMMPARRRSAALGLSLIALGVILLVAAGVVLSW